MASNKTLDAVQDRGWLGGFGNLFRREGHQWWGTWQWLVQALIWMAIVNGMLAMVVLTAPKVEAAREAREIMAEEAAIAERTLSQTALMVFFLFSGMAPAVGVVIMGQDALIGERQNGTAAWILSKPVSRQSFIMSKLCADALGILVSMVIVQGGIAYVIYRTGTGMGLPVGGFLAGLGLLYLLLLFYLALTYMLGTLFRNRGPVIGIPMVLIFGNQLAGVAPILGRILPWNLVMDLGPDQPALAVSLAQGQSLPAVTPVIGTAILAVFFVAVGLWRFQHEEF